MAHSNCPEVAKDLLLRTPPNIIPSSFSAFFGTCKNFSCGWENLRRLLSRLEMEVSSSPADISVADCAYIVRFFESPSPLCISFGVLCVFPDELSERLTNIDLGCFTFEEEAAVGFGGGCSTIVGVVLKRK